MSRLNWNVPEGRFFDTGLDRGVLYPKGAAPIGQVLATNLMTNPSFGTNTAGWTADNGTITRVSEGDGFVGGYVSTASSAANNVTYSPSVPVVPNSGYSASIDLKMQGVASEYKLYIFWYNNVGGFVGNALATYPAANLSGTIYTRMNVSATAPAGGVQARIVVIPTNGLTVGAGYRIDKAQLTKTAVAQSYFDGDTLDTAVDTYEWTGTPHASTSIRREVLTRAVPWIGLQSVDEEGGESAAAYYIDGRPFLFLPRPKEFKASLKAITYPDAFSEIMGIQEVADGMYLDSQAGASFDLSYRTLVGNAVDGVDHGYKIHLVYNCTVAPQSLSYESMSDAINPTSFAWEIQAVPVKVEGFRPTAHIIIDTRHMSQSKVDAVEAMLYGDEESLAKMPSPQAVFDLLSFGDTIIVTDNGDGTFDVTGSYENVYMTGEGIFRIDNIDGTNNGDGTFTISTTDE